MDATNLIVYLPFDTSTTVDPCGGSWTAYNDPQIVNGAATFSGANQYLELDGSLTLGGQDFTIAVKINLSSTAGSWIHIFNLWTTSNSDANKIAFQRNNAAAQCRGIFFGSQTANFNFALDTVHHVEFDYVHAVGKIYIFVDGTLATTFNKSIARTTFPNVHIGRSNYDNPYFVGTVDEFMIFEGVALHTDNFTPPTDDDYAALKIAGIPLTLAVDVERKVKNAALTWRYENAGNAEELLVGSWTSYDLPESQSKTGIAFVNRYREKCFDLPATNEVWMKFDVYFDGSNRWRAYNDEGDGLLNGISAQQTSTSTGILSFFASTNQSIYQGENVTKVNQLQTVLLHMVSGSTAGVVEAWVDGSLIYRYTGDVNHGEDFADLYLQSDGGNTFFSNVIISNAPIDLAEGWQIFSIDVERTVDKTVALDFDLERRVKNVVDFELDADIELKDFLPVTLTADLLRNVIRAVEFDVDLELLDVIPTEFIADLELKRPIKIKLYPTDTAQYFSGDGVTPVTIPTQYVIPPARDDEATFQSIELVIAEQQITEQVNIVGIVPFDILNQVKGEYLDYNFNMRIESSRQQGSLFSYNCCSNLDSLLFTQFHYTIVADFLAYQIDLKKRTINIRDGSHEDEVDKEEIIKAHASTHLQRIANALGLNCSVQFDDFVSAMDIEQKNVTYNDLISSLFGWTSRLPNLMINCFIRDGTLYAVQRGHEKNLIDLTSSEHTLPIIEKKLCRTMWGSSADTTYQLVHHYPGWDVYPPPPTSSEDGKTTYVYRNVSGYGQIEHGYCLIESTTINEDGGRTIVNYSYNFVDHNIYTCTSETSVTYDADGEEIDRKTTTHHLLTPSQQFSRVADADGNTTATGISSHLPGFYNKKITWFEAHDDTEDKTLPAHPLIDVNFPVVYGKNEYRKYTSILVQLNRKTQETISMDIYNFPHLIDFNDRIIFNGQEYFLVANRALTNTNVFNKQSVSFTRWYR